ncbi:MAG: NADH-quinone oxidoreductase subunit C [Thiotrichaceae bacterium]
MQVPTSESWWHELHHTLLAAHPAIRLNLKTLSTFLVEIEVADWYAVAELMAQRELRWVALWAAQQPQYFVVNVCYEQLGNYLIVRTNISSEPPRLKSLTPLFPAANRMERHTQDLYGITFTDSLDSRRWTRHQAWQADDYPLRKHFPLIVQQVPPTPPDFGYPFMTATGTGVYDIPVGPVHAGIIEPGHFRFQAVGERVLNLEIRLGYVHKGVEKLAEGRDAMGLARLAGRVSGDTTVGHTWAACMAMERATATEVPLRGLMLRAIMAERERVANHLGDIGAICNDVGFAFALYQFHRLKETWLRMNEQGFGHRMLMDCIIPGGVKTDLTPTLIEMQRQQLEDFTTELKELEGIIERHMGLEDLLSTTGILSQEQARQLGCVGYVGRASGQTFDVRKQVQYSPYDQFQFGLRIPTMTAGDVESRMMVRWQELYVSLELLGQILVCLPENEPIAVEWQPVRESVEGIGMVEGWRGEIFTYVRLDSDGMVTRYFPRDPSWLNWQALELLIMGNIVPDFPVCNKSVNGSYTGCDL